MKNNKIIGVALAIIMVLCCFALTLTFNGGYASAAEAEKNKNVTVDKLWEVNNSYSSLAVNPGGGVKISLNDEAVATYKTEIDTSNLTLKLKLGNTDFSSFTLTFKGENARGDEIENVLTAVKSGANINFTLNGGEEKNVAFGESKEINVTYNEAEKAFYVNGSKLLGEANEGLWPLFKLSVAASGVSERFEFAVTEINGEIFKLNDAGAVILDETAPYLYMPEDRNPEQLPVGCQYELKFKAIDVISEAKTTITVSLKDGEIPEGEEEDYFKKDGSKIEFKKTGFYVINFKITDNAGNETSVDYEIEAVAEDTVAPVYDTSRNDEYQALIDELAENIDMNEDLLLPLPFVSDNVSKPKFMKYVVASKSPSSTTWSYRTISDQAIDITLGNTGTYIFKIIPYDLSGNSIPMSECPEFKIVVRDTTAPEITVPDSFPKVGYLGIKMTIPSLTITEPSVYEQYSILEYFNESTGNWESVELDEDNAFTPDKLGKYRYKLFVTDSFLNTAESDYLEFEVVEPVEVNNVKEWFQENYLSVIFLSVAALCAIAIVVLLILDARARKKNSD